VSDHEKTTQSPRMEPARFDNIRSLPRSKNVARRLRPVSDHEKKTQSPRMEPARFNLKPLYPWADAGQSRRATSPEIINCKNFRCTMT